MISCDKLRCLETRHSLSTTCCMPYMPTKLFLIIPMAFFLCYNIGYSNCCVILITSHHLEYTFICISDCIADKHMRHWYRKKLLDKCIPVINRIIVKISPVEIECFIKRTLFSRIGKINRFLRLHRYKNLHKRKNTSKYTFA